jgi:ATP-dependent protease HslVU (ClpYQ) peptidase subunit
MRREFVQCLIILLVFVYGSHVEALAQGAHTAYGTAIAAYRTENEIIVAADSKPTSGDGTSYVGTICKIRQFGDIFVAAAGLYREPVTNFDLWEIVSMAFLEGTELSDIVKRFETFVESPLQNAVTAVKNQKPNLYQEKHLNKASIMVLFLRIEDNVLTMKYREFAVFPETNDLLSVFVKRCDCPGYCCSDGRGVVLVGKMGGDKKIEEIFISPFLSRDAKCNVVDLARRFVETMIDRDSVNFGPRIDILSITKDGAKWIQKKEICPEIRK